MAASSPTKHTITMKVTDALEETITGRKDRIRQRVVGVSPSNNTTYLEAIDQTHLQVGKCYLLQNVDLVGPNFYSISTAGSILRTYMYMRMKFNAVANTSYCNLCNRKTKSFSANNANVSYNSHGFKKPFMAFTQQLIRGQRNSVAGKISSLSPIKETSSGSVRGIEVIPHSSSDIKLEPLRANLWRNASQLELSITQDIEVWDTTVTYSSFEKCDILQVNNVIDVKVKDMADKVMKITLVAVGAIDDTYVSFLSAGQTYFRISKADLQEFLSIEMGEDELVEVLNMEVTGVLKTDIMKPTKVEINKE